MKSTVDSNTEKTVLKVTKNIMGVVDSNNDINFLLKTPNDIKSVVEAYTEKILLNVTEDVESDVDTNTVKMLLKITNDFKSVMWFCVCNEHKSVLPTPLKNTGVMYECKHTFKKART